MKGHLGKEKTIKLVQRNFYWPRMTDFVTHYVHSCGECQHNKSVHHKTDGLLQPLETPYCPWISISNDYIIQLPELRENNQMCVIVDRFTNMAHFNSLKERATAGDVARAFVDNL